MQSRTVCCRYITNSDACYCTCVCQLGVVSSPVSCVCWYLSSLLHLYHHDYKEAEMAAENGDVIHLKMTCFIIL